MRIWCIILVRSVIICEAGKRFARTLAEENESISFVLGAKKMKRSRHEIISKILDVCIDGANKSKVVHLANLNFRTVNPYLNLLIKKDLIKASQGQPIQYETTPAGISLLNGINRIQDKLSQF